MEISLMPDLSEDTVIWRYMALDKFICLLSTSSLYMSHLGSYSESDPYEGYPPRPLIKVMRDLHEGRVGELQRELDKLFIKAKSQDAPSNAIEKLQALQSESLLKFRAGFRPILETVFKSTLVNCWYDSSHESEAMWKLYSEQQKGIAIRTTVRNVTHAFAASPPLSGKRLMRMGRVRYIDYADPNLQINDCIVGGQISPLLKRISYAHENEVRLYTMADVTPQNIETFKASGCSLAVNLNSLIQEVYVSPYADSLFGMAVDAVVEAFGLKCPVRKSSLLAGVEGLFDHIEENITLDGAPPR